MPKKTQARDGIYERADRPGFWGSWIDSNGRRKRRKFDAPTLTQARALLAAEKATAEKNRTLGFTPPGEDSFSEFANEFLKFQEKRISAQVAKGKLSREEYIRQEGIVEKHLKPFFGPEMKLAAIRRSDVIRYIHKRTGEVSDGTVIKEMNVMKRLFNVAVDLDKIPANPAQRAPMPQAPEGRIRWLTNDELHRVLTACYLPPIQNESGEQEEQDQWLQHAAGLTVALGTRRGELLNVTLPDVDLDTRVILLRRTKSGKRRPAFINDLAMQVLDSMEVRELKQKRNRGLLFPHVDKAQLTVYFIRACKKAGIEDFSLHDLRHTFASHHKQNGTDLYEIQKLLGQSDPRMAARYAHLGEKHLAKVAENLNGVLTLPRYPPKEKADEVAVVEGGAVFEWSADFAVNLHQPRR
jgi:integrase